LSHWYLQPVLNSYAAVALAAVVLCLLLLVGPAFRRLTRLQRSVLIALRLLVISLLVTVMLRPTHVSTSRRPQTAVLIAMFDRSRSMQLPHSATRRSRWEVQLETLRTAVPVLQDLAENMEVRLYGFDQQLKRTELGDVPQTLPESPDGPQTDIGTSLHEALQNELGKRLAAVVLLSDGAQTAFAPTVEIQEAGRELERLGCPLYAVAFGPATDTVQAQDVAVENLQDQYTVFVKNELPVQATVRVQGYVNKQIPVEMTVEKPDGAMEKVGPLSIMAREDGERLPVSLRYVPDQPGSYKLTVSAAEQAGELVTKNNRLTAFLRVLEGGLKILYLEGELRPEQKFLRRSLDASSDMEVDFVWVDSRDRARWPADLGDTLRDPRYDAFVLGDLDATALGTAHLEVLADAVDRGKGLLLIGGYHSFGAGGYRETPLADVMPIEMDRFERQDFDAPVRNDLHLEGPIRMVPVLAHPVVSLTSDAENTGAWQRLPPLKGANRFVGVKDAAGVRVIAESDRGDPLLVVGEYGRGRVVAMAGDSTWRWWMQDHAEEHRRFWRQAILWLVGREDLQQDQVWIKLAQRRYHQGGRVTFTAGVSSSAGQPIENAVVRADLTLPDESAADLRLTRDEREWMGTIESLELPGDYAITVTAEQDGNVLGTARGEFLVYDRDIELSNAAADHDQLARLAAMTEQFGGRLVAPEQLVALLEEVRDKPPEMEIEIQTKWQLADTARDAWVVFLLFVVLLTGEWFLRKKWNLV
jgi:uncharacterized membrane protein